MTAKVSTVTAVDVSSTRKETVSTASNDANANRNGLASRSSTGSGVLFDGLAPGVAQSVRLEIVRQIHQIRTRMSRTIIREFLPVIRGHCVVRTIVSARPSPQRVALALGHDSSDCPAVLGGQPTCNHARTSGRVCRRKEPGACTAARLRVRTRSVRSGQARRRPDRTPGSLRTRTACRRSPGGAVRPAPAARCSSGSRRCRGPRPPG